MRQYPHFVGVSIVFSSYSVAAAMRKRVRVESQAASATAAHVADDAADADSLWHCDSAYALVGLAPGRSIFIHGRCTAWLTGGRVRARMTRTRVMCWLIRSQVSIAGATLSAADGAVDLYVPLTRAALCIACPDDEDARPASELALPDAHAADCGNRRVGAVLVMVPLNSDAEATPLTRRLFGPSHGAQWLRVSRSPEDARERFPPSWAALVHSHADAAVDGPPVLLVCGRRGVGKSSLVRAIPSLSTAPLVWVPDARCAGALRRQHAAVTRWCGERHSCGYGPRPTRSGSARHRVAGQCDASAAVPVVLRSARRPSERGAFAARRGHGSRW